MRGWGNRCVVVGGWGGNGRLAPRFGVIIVESYLLLPLGNMGTFEWI
jgi:hypothetical protein